MFRSPKGVAFTRERPFSPFTRATLMRLLLTAAAAALFALPAQAQFPVPASYSGNTATDAEGTFRRPINTDCANLSNTGTNVAYQTQAFSVSESGGYNFESVQPGFDGYLFLYQGSFDPVNQCAGFLNGNDDGFGGIGTSSFSNSLASGTTYVLVTSGYDNEDSGAYTNTIFGPESATVTFVDGGGGEPDLVTLAVTPLDTDLAPGEKARFQVAITNADEQDYTGSLTVSIDGTPVLVKTGRVRRGQTNTYEFKLNFSGRPDDVYAVRFTIASAELGGEVETEGPFFVTKGGFEGPGGDGPPTRFEPFATTVERLKAAGDEKALEAVLAERAALVQGIGVEQGVRRRGAVEAVEVK